METLVIYQEWQGVMHGCRLWFVVVHGDELDVVCSAVSNISYVSVTPAVILLKQRKVIIDKFRHATMKWNQNATVQSGTEGNEIEEQNSHMIVATDVGSSSACFWRISHQF